MAKLHRRLQRGARAQRQADGRQDPCRPAPETSNTSRAPAGEMLHRRAPSGKGSCPCPARVTMTALAVVAASRASSAASTSAVRSDRQSRRRRQLRSVGLDDVHRAVAGEVTPLGIDHDRRA